MQYYSTTIQKGAIIQGNTRYIQNKNWLNQFLQRKSVNSVNVKQLPDQQNKTSLSSLAPLSHKNTENWAFRQLEM